MIKNIFGAAVLAVGATFFAGAFDATEAATIKFYNEVDDTSGALDTLRFDVTCSLGCVGVLFTASDVYDGTDPAVGDLVDFVNNGNADALAQSIADANGFGTLGPKVETPATDFFNAAPFTTSAQIMSFKIGTTPNLGFIINSHKDNVISYAATCQTGKGGTNCGLSNVREWGDVGDGGTLSTIPVPASLPLLAGAFGIAGIALRRRKRA